MNEFSSIKEVKGVGEKTAQKLEALGITKVHDILYYLPNRYDIYEEPVKICELEEGRCQSVLASVRGRVKQGGSRKLPVTTADVYDETGNLRVVWFRMPFVKNIIKPGTRFILRGKVQRKNNLLEMEQAEIFADADKYEEKRNYLIPKYKVRSGISSQFITKCVQAILEEDGVISELLPKEVCEDYHLMNRKEALWYMHFPKTATEHIQARERIVFEEFLSMILSMRKLNDKELKEKSSFEIKENTYPDRLLKSLPYELTGAQKRVWNEVSVDMQGEYVMSRLIQGDVGSGKTILALLALLLVCENGYQGALMAPTEVLARQHFISIKELLENCGLENVNVVLLTGSMKAKEKREAYEKISCGEADIVIGTHALIQKKAIYHNLALVITDEQHRFGVRQRETLAQKGDAPHILVMSATPIPRTLAIIVYGDLDLSVVDELPANRLPIKNCVVDTGYRETAYRFIYNQVKEGRQCYVICPMVEESENLEAENVIDYSEKLSQALGKDIKVAYLHGKMKQQDKDEIMEAFAANQIQVLVSTTVIEVGINVPNATVMLVENAERFGLAQLHQLRGRVGRGKHQSYCIFMSGSKVKESKERLEILNQSNDGFFIANEDLKLRGPGDIFGIRQSGMFDLQVGDVFQDSKVLQEANEAVSKYDLSEFSKFVKTCNNF